MNDPVTFNLTGKPQGWQRAGRDGRNGGRHYTQKETRSYKRSIAIMAAIATRGRGPMDGALALDLRAVFEIPASWSQRKKDRALLGEIRPTVKPDMDNIIKGICDAMNKIVYGDDAQIVDYSGCKKVYGLQPLVVVTVRPVQ